jgi:hypothetical protein
MKPLIAFAVALVLAGASTGAGSPHDAAAQAKLDKYLAGRVAGETKHCLAVDKTAHPVGIDDSTILFIDGPRVWQSQLSGSFECGKIDRQSVIITESGAQRMCAGDKLVFENGTLSGACYVGEFTPYTKP